MILKQKAFQKIVPIMKLKENQENKCHIAESNSHNKHSLFMERNSPTPNPLGHRAVEIRSFITCTVQVNRTSWLRQNNDENILNPNRNVTK